MQMGERNMEKIKITPNKTIEWLKDISTRGRLKKALSYEGISLWWFYEFELYYLIEKYVKNKKYDGEGAFKRNKPKFISKFAKYHIIFRAIARSILGKIICKRIKNKQSENSSTHKILAVSYTSYWKNYPTPQKGNKGENRDTMLGDIITTLQNKNFDVIAIDADTTFFIDFKTMIEKRIPGKDLWRPVEAYLTYDIIRKVFKAAKKYKEEWDKLKNNNKFVDSLNDDYDGFRMSDLLKDYFEKLFKYRTFSPVLDIELMKRAIEVEKPDLVLITCGYCQLGRAAVIAGKLKGVPTLEIQHGNIHPFHPGYMHAKDEISPDGNVKSPYCPIPDKMAVYGSYYKELLTKMSVYPEDSVVVTGQSRYDFLYHADSIYSKNAFFKKYKINPEHKVILWTTQCHGISGEENVKNFKAVFRTIQNLKDVTLVIKQHPNEGKRYTKIIKDYLNKYNLEMNTVITPKSSDTYGQLFVCDLMITRHSTTAMEAIALNKPVIILNLSGEPDHVEYVKEGVALGVYREEDLKQAIEKLLKDDSELAKKREKYIEKYLYKIDGKATERVVGLITQMIEERKEKNERQNRG